MSDPAILITIPDLGWQGGGGVTEIYRSTALNSIPHIRYFVIRPAKIKFRFLQLIHMYISFAKEIRDVDIVHVNPSLNFHAIVRDGILVLISRRSHKKIIVSIHGWRNDFEQSILNRYLMRKLFTYTYEKVDAFIVLGQIFQDKLNRLLPKSKALYFRMPTIADSTFLNEFDIVSYRRDRIISNHTFTLLFLSRLVADKGLDIVIKVQQLLESDGHHHFHTIIAGDGALKEWAEKSAGEYNLQHIEFTGFVTGLKKHNVLLQADALFFPSQYNEGLPCAVLEAMLYGLPVITRNVGSLPEWIRNQENGAISDSISPEFYANTIIGLANSKELRTYISALNHQIAIDNFTTSIIKERILNIYRVIG